MRALMVLLWLLKPLSPRKAVSPRDLSPSGYLTHEVCRRWLGQREGQSGIRGLQDWGGEDEGGGGGGGVLVYAAVRVF